MGYYYTYIKTAFETSTFYNYGSCRTEAIFAVDLFFLAPVLYKLQNKNLSLTQQCDTK